MSGIMLLVGILAAVLAVVVALKAIYKHDYTLIGKIVGLLYIIVGIGIYLANPKSVQLEILHLGIIIYFLGDLFSSLLYFMLRKQTDKIKQVTLLKSLADMSEKYYSIVEHSPMGFYVFDTDGRIEYVNSYLCDILGYTKEELIGKIVFDLMDEEYKKIAKENVSKRIHGNVKTVSYVLKMYKKNSEPIFLKAIGSRTENGHPTITGSLVEIRLEDIEAWKSQLLL